MRKMHHGEIQWFADDQKQDRLLLEENTTIWIGSSQDCDICLSGSDIASYHLGISFDAKEKGFWVIRETEGEVWLADGRELPVGEEVFLSAGETVLVGDGTHYFVLEQHTLRNTSHTTNNARVNKPQTSQKSRWFSIVCVIFVLTALVTVGIFGFRYFQSKRPTTTPSVNPSNTESSEIETERNETQLYAQPAVTQSVNDLTSAINATGEVLSISEPDSVFQEQLTTTYLDDTYYRLQQIYNGIKVYGRTVTIMAGTDGTVRALSGNYLVTPADVDINPKLAETEGNKQLESYILDSLQGDPDKEIRYLQRELNLYDLDGTAAQLAYVVDVSFTSKELGFVNYQLVQNATTGEVLYAVSLTCYGTVTMDGNTSYDVDLTQSDSDPKIWYTSDTARNFVVYNAGGKEVEMMPLHNNGELIDGSEAITESFLYRPYTIMDHNLTPLTAGSYKESALSEDSLFLESSDEKGLIVMEQVKDAWDYYSNVLNRNGFDGRQGDLNVIYNVYDPGQPDSVNASGGSCLGYATIQILKNMNLSIDMTGHEYTHTVEHSISSLNGDNESGALAETFADLFGELIEGYTYNRDPDWSNGARRLNYEDYKIDYAMKYAADPQMERSHDKNEDNVYFYSKEYFTKRRDIHNNSTIGSYAGYLIYSGWRNDGMETSTAITMLSRLLYRSLFYMWSDVTYGDWGWSLETIAAQMKANGELTSSKQVQIVSDALTTVGINVNDSNLSETRDRQNQQTDLLKTAAYFLIQNNEQQLNTSIRRMMLMECLNFDKFDAIEDYDGHLTYRWYLDNADPSSPTCIQDPAFLICTEDLLLYGVQRLFGSQYDIRLYNNLEKVEDTPDNLYLPKMKLKYVKDPNNALYKKITLYSIPKEQIGDRFTQIDKWQWNILDETRIDNLTYDIHASVISPENKEYLVTANMKCDPKIEGAFDNQYYLENMTIASSNTEETITQETAQTPAPANPSDVLSAYLKDVLVPQYGVMPTDFMSYEYASSKYPPWGSTDLTGLLSGNILDFDGDGVEELLTTAFVGSEEGGGSPYTRTELSLRMYEYDSSSGEVFQSAERHLKTPSNFCFGISGYDQICVFTYQYQGGTYIAVDTNLYFNGSTSTLALFQYGGTGMEFLHIPHTTSAEKSVTQRDGTSFDFVYGAGFQASGEGDYIVSDLYLENDSLLYCGAHDSGWNTLMEYYVYNSESTQVTQISAEELDTFYSAYYALLEEIGLVVNDERIGMNANGCTYTLEEGYCRNHITTPDFYLSAEGSISFLSGIYTHTGELLHQSKALERKDYYGTLDDFRS